MDTYPVLHDRSTMTNHRLQNTPSFVVGRSPDAHLPLTDISCSRKHFRILYEAGRYMVEPLSTSGPTLCNGKRIESRTLLTHGTILQAGNLQFVFLERAEIVGEKWTKMVAASEQMTQAPKGAVLPMSATVQAGSQPAALSAEASLKGAITLSSSMLIGREPGKVQIVLPHVHISRIHAQITLQGNRAIVSDLNSQNGTFVNGKRIAAPVTIQKGDRIDIGPYSLAFSGTALLPQTRANNVELTCRNLRRIVKDRLTGNMIRLLDDISLVVRPNEFVCLLGPSGSGKTTLLSAMSGRVPADEGAVLLNQKDLYRLPTEAEWEYACRAGTTTPFYFGENISTDQANYDGNLTYGNGKKGVNRKKSTPVGSFPPNAWGLYDMSGNLEQWCQDWYGDYPQGDVVDPQGKSKELYRVLRGGSWNYPPVHCRSAWRTMVLPGRRHSHCGFRICFFQD